MSDLNAQTLSNLNDQRLAELRREASTRSALRQALDGRGPANFLRALLGGAPKPASVTGEALRA